MKPLIAKRETKNAESAFHRAVFAKWGRKCFECGNHATDSAHILRRGTKLGKHRFCSPEIARPLCRRCHDLDTEGKYQWPLAVRQSATIEYNKHTKIPIQVPTE